MKKSKTKKTKAPKQYTHPIMRSLHGQNLAVDFKMLPNGKYTTTEYWKGWNAATLIAMGYVPAIDYKSSFAHMFTRVFVRFEGFERYPCMRTETGARDGDELIPMETLETASTLYDHFKSNAEEEFMNDMKAKKLSSMSTKQIILYAVIAIGAAIGLFMVFGGGH